MSKKEKRDYRYSYMMANFIAKYNETGETRYLSSMAGLIKPFLDKNDARLITINQKMARMYKAKHRSSDGNAKHCARCDILQQEITADLYVILVEQDLIPKDIDTYFKRQEDKLEELDVEIDSEGPDPNG